MCNHEWERTTTRWGVVLTCKRCRDTKGAEPTYVEQTYLDAQREKYG